MVQFKGSRERRSKYFILEVANYIPMCEEVKITIPLPVLKANYDRRGYFVRYRHHYREIREEKGSVRGIAKAAWEATESELENFCLPSRYSSYESFVKNKNHLVRIGYFRRGRKF